MINKKSLWFLTLFSLILVLSVYYVTMPNELLLTNNNSKNISSTDKGKDDDTNVSLEVSESSVLVALRVESDEEMLKELDDLKKVLTDTESSVEEKNNAFEKMKDLNVTRGEEETIEKKILEEFKLNSFVKVNGDQVRVVIQSEEHDSTLANKIMRSVQQNYTNKMYISVKFQK